MSPFWRSVIGIGVFAAAGALIAVSLVFDGGGPVGLVLGIAALVGCTVCIGLGVASAIKATRR
jgi:hypothetical protein